MPLLIPPVTLIAFAICLGEDTESMLLVILVLAFVLSPVVPDIVPVALHVVALPLSLVLSAIEPRVDACPRDLVLLPLTHIL